MNMTLLKSWGWPNASENFHMQLHKYTVKVSKPPILSEPSLQTLEVMHGIQLYHACMLLCTHTLGLHVCMYVHVPVTVLTP